MRALLSFLSCGAALAGLASPSAGQAIDFEDVPGVGIPWEGLTIDNQFQATDGITFSLEGGGAPVVAKVGAPATAFGGPPTHTTPDQPALGQGTSTYFLTDDGVWGGVDSPALIIRYNPPTDAASGVVLDIDIDEILTIQLRNQNDMVLEQRIIRAGDFGTGDGIATPWSFQRGASDVYSIRLKGRRTFSGAFGMAFDNFAARQANPCPFPAISVARNGSGVNPVGFIELTPAVVGQNWITYVDVSTPQALSSFLAVTGGGPTSGTILGGNVHGELLCLPPVLYFEASANGFHAVPVPADCALAGATVWAQAATFKPHSIAFNNALDVTIGSF